MHIAIKKFLFATFFLWISCSHFAFGKQLYNELLLSVIINGVKSDKIILFIEDNQKNFYVEDSEINTWHLKLPQAQLLSYDDKKFYPLSALKQAHIKLNQRELSIAIEIPPNFQQGSSYSVADSKKIAPDAVKLGGFINYDLNTQSTVGVTQYSALSEAGIFTQFGVGVSSQLITILGSNKRLTRLNSTWNTDLPASMHTLMVGDAFTKSPVWGQSVGFAGIEWGTNFTTQPYFIPYPLPKLGGIAAIPSAVDLYVNNALISRTNVPAGAFSITNIPSVNGNGVANVVVTDLLGREQIINLPFYGSSAMLKAGLSDESYSIGFIRINFGIESNHYGQLFVNTNNRYGVTDNITTELHTELLTTQQTVGLSESLLLNRIGTLTTAMAMSHSHGRTGKLGLMSYQYQSLLNYSYGVNLQITSRAFTRLGQTANTSLASFQSQTYVSFPIHTYSVSVSYTTQNNRSAANSNFLTLSANANLPHHVAANLTAMKTIGQLQNNSVFLTFTTAIDDRHTASVRYNNEPMTKQAQVTLQQSLPTDTGYGYNLNVGEGTESSHQLTAYGQSKYGNYTVIAARQAHQSGYQFDANGSISLVNNGLYASRMLTDSFGVASIPGYENVTIYLNNQPIGSTNANGTVFIPRLLPYSRNVLQIHPDTLPISANIENDTIILTPPFRSGVTATFPIHAARDAFIHIKTQHGKPVPPGALIAINRDAKNYFVSHDGDAYVANLHDNNEIRIAWPKHHCEFKLKYLPTSEIMPDLGEFICQEK